MEHSYRVFFVIGNHNTMYCPGKYAIKSPQGNPANMTYTAGGRTTVTQPFVIHPTRGELRNTLYILGEEILNRRSFKTGLTEWDRILFVPIYVPGGHFSLPDRNASISVDSPTWNNKIKPLLLEIKSNPRYDVSGFIFLEGHTTSSLNDFQLQLTNFQVKALDLLEISTGQNVSWLFLYPQSNMNYQYSLQRFKSTDGPVRTNFMTAAEATTSQNYDLTEGALLTAASESLWAPAGEWLVNGIPSQNTSLLRKIINIILSYGGISKMVFGLLAAFVIILVLQFKLERGKR